MNWFGSASSRFIAGGVSGPGARVRPVNGAMGTARVTSARSWAAQAAMTPPIERPTTMTLSPRPRPMSTAWSVAAHIARASSRASAVVMRSASPCSGRRGM